MQIDGEKYLELPSTSRFRVMQILAEDGNEYLLLEASDWVTLAQDWAKNPGKLRKPAREGLIDFLAWFAAEGLYAQAYTILKRVYTYEDDQRVQGWIMSRESGKPARREWGFEVQDKDPRGRYGYWTNYVYRGLFGMDATAMKEEWESPVSGSSHIARGTLWHGCHRNERGMGKPSEWQQSHCSQLYSAVGGNRSGRLLREDGGSARSRRH